MYERNYYAEEAFISRPRPTLYSTQDIRRAAGPKTAAVAAASDDEDGEPSDDSFSFSDARAPPTARARRVSGASTGDGGGPMRGCPPRRAPVGSQGVLSLDIRGLTGWNALCLVPNSTTLVGCVLLLRWSSDAMVCNSRILPQRLRWCV